MTKFQKLTLTSKVSCSEYEREPKIFFSNYGTYERSLNIMKTQLQKKDATLS